jgi:anhydro-N-acetylmuramic acid kinase
MKHKKTYKIIGLMSGTSMDGLDIAYCIFSRKGIKWTYKIKVAETIPYDSAWKHRLQNLETGTALEFALSDTQYGHLLGKETHKFIRKHNLNPDFIASHGHTIFHQPAKGLSSQIGHGAAIAAECGLPVVCDFRTKDIALGGQGAPLVPIGDELLFSAYTSCINLGGFANISFRKNCQRLGFDICPVNIVLNSLSNKLGKNYDPEGRLAKKGRINETLLKQLNTLPYYWQPPPKSLGKEWVTASIIPLLEHSGANPFDQLRTFTEHAAIQISKALSDPTIQNPIQHPTLVQDFVLPLQNLVLNTPAGCNIQHKYLITGGGAHNRFLIERITALSKGSIIIPDKNTIEFKEALVFALLGLLRWTNQVNCLCSATGAKSDSIGGCIYSN